MKKISLAVIVLFVSILLYADTNYYKDLEKKAAGGDSDAQYELGLEYIDGSNIKQDYAAALKWIKLSADKKYPEACYKLGEMYSNGTGVAVNEAESLKWYLIAGEEGHIEARRILGYAYKDGIGGAKKNLNEAAKWFEKIADSYGNKTVLAELAAVYYEMKDYGKAAAAYKNALEGYEPFIGAAPKLAEIYYKGISGKPDYTEAYYYWSICRKAKISFDSKMKFTGKLKTEEITNIEARADEFVSRYQMNMGRGGD